MLPQRCTPTACPSTMPPTNASATMAALDRWIARIRERRPCRRRHRNHQPGRDAGRSRRHLALRRCRAGLLYPARPHAAAAATSSARPTWPRARLPMDRGAGRAETGAGGPGDPEDRPEHEIRLEDLRPPRHPHHALRRHDADVLRHACGPAPPRHGRTVRPLPRPSRRSRSRSLLGSGKSQVTFDRSPSTTR